MLWTIGNGESLLKMSYNSHKDRMYINEYFSQYWLTWIVLATSLLQPCYGSLDFSQDNPVEPVPEETFIRPG